MSVVETEDSFVVAAAQQISLGQMFSTTASSANPSYLVLTGLDRDEYTAGATGATGSLSGNGQTASFGDLSGDARAIGIVFTYDASTGQYYNAEYGDLDQMTFTASGSLNDVTDLSLFGFSNLSQASAWANDPYTLMSWDSAGYLGSITIATQPGFSGTVPTQATPDSIASTAATFVGKAWNMDGCWVLASTIAAEAGAALPVQSTAVGLPGQANGEWMVAFNGPAGQSGNWQSMVTAGDVVVIEGPSGNGHVTTCVSGSGASAMLIDNITYVDASGQTVNSANDGSSSDVTIAAPHLASGEWAGVQAQNVVIYRLDTPVVSESETTANLATGASLALQPIFSATDPFNTPVTEYQIYDTAAGDSLSVNGTAVAAHSASSADTIMSLGSACLVAGAGTCTDTVEVRAFNGSYWGDWQALTVAVSAASAPTLASQTPNQIWSQGSRVAFTLPAGTFVDPQGETLTYAATLSKGQALPSWLTFKPTTGTFSGTVPSGLQTLSLSVTATDTSGLSASETFQVTVPAAAPRLNRQTTAQTWTEGQPVSFALPANTFTDPQGEALHYAATLSNGQALPGWLAFDTSTGTFSGTAPYASSPLSLKVTTTDTSGLSTSETFRATLVAPPPTVTDQTANQAWTAGQVVSLALPADTFTAVPGQAIHYSASLANGRALPAGLVFNAATRTFIGRAPLGLGTYTIKVAATGNSGVSAYETFDVVVSAKPPTVANPTADQTWTAGQRISLTLPANTFADPQGEKLSFTATQADGSALPRGLVFNAATRTLSGTAPITPETLRFKVTATDASGLSASGTFSAVVQAASPALAHQTANQVWTDGQSMNFLLPKGTFSDPQGSPLTYAAVQVSGANQTSWLRFNASTADLTGLVPAGASGTIGIKVVATDAYGVSVSETFGLTFAASGSHVSVVPSTSTQTETLPLHG